MPVSTRATEHSAIEPISSSIHTFPNHTSNMPITSNTTTSSTQATNQRLEAREVSDPMQHISKNQAALHARMGSKGSSDFPAYLTFSGEGFEVAKDFLQLFNYHCVVLDVPMQKKGSFLG